MPPFYVLFGPRGEGLSKSNDYFTDTNILTLEVKNSRPPTGVDDHRQVFRIYVPSNEEVPIIVLERLRRIETEVFPGSEKFPEWTK